MHNTQSKDAWRALSEARFKRKLLRGGTADTCPHPHVFDASQPLPCLLETERGQTEAETMGRYNTVHTREQDKAEMSAKQYATQRQHTEPTCEEAPELEQMRCWQEILCATEDSASLTVCSCLCG